jgi:hypothetical protein
MAGNNLTIIQRLNNAFRGTGRNMVSPDVVTSQNYTQNRVLYTTNDKADYEKKLNSLKQQKYLAYQWKKAGADNSMESLAGYTAVKLMYRDVDLMDGCPEIGAALDIVSEEACPITSKGTMLNVYSKSNRTKAMLEDLFVNRLHIYTDLPMIARHLAKYGNTFMLLNIDKDNGVMGWRMLPVYEMDRNEDGISIANAAGMMVNNNGEIKPDVVTFTWVGHNESRPYANWQIAHFRLLNDSLFLPYGVSMLHKARRAWRMWSMMEDAMLIWRLDKAIERRVFKIYVGNIDDQDVPAFIQDIANNFKRTQIVDPATGQIDLRKNFLDVSSDYFIPVRREDAPNPIETLQAANSQVQMEDIEYMQNKMFAAMRVPKTFLNFQEAQGKGQNLSIMDIRFSRMINRIQQFILMELNKIAMVHLFIMGLTDEIGNFTLSLNNPSSQIEAQELDDLTKRLNAMQLATTAQGNGMPMMSLHRALKDIMKMSDSEIKDMLNEIYLEKAMAAEIEAAGNIIKDSGLFNTVKRIYGDYDALNGNAAPQQSNGDEEGDDLMGGGGGGGLGMGGDLGGDMDMDMGEPGSEEGGDLSGTAGDTDMGGAPSADEGSPVMEVIKKKVPLLREHKNGKKEKVKSFTQRYFEMLSEGQKIDDGITEEAFDFDGKNATEESKIQEIFAKIDKIVDEDAFKKNAIIEEALNDLSGTSIDSSDANDEE